LPAAVSSLDEMANGSFHRLLHDTTVERDKVRRVVMCTGKIYYELADERARRKDETVAIVRIEKLYPWWPHLVNAAIDFPNLKELFWVQDEPCNMGAGPFVTPRLEQVLRERGGNVKYECISRTESASPATGSHKAHVIEQLQILKAAFDPR
jgi:2-oxoglutarate dehydrogenase E1 component